MKAGTMKNRRNYYRVLQVQPDAPTEVIRASFRTLMRELKQHPDLGGSTRDASLLIEAYETLTYPQRRAEYDRVTFARYTKQAVSAPNRAKPPLTTVLCPFCKRPLARKAQPGENCPTCRIPLQSARTQGASEASRRCMARVRKDERILYWTSWPGEAREARMLDLSPKGMRFLCGEKLSPGVILKIEDPLLRASAVVSNLREEEAGGSMAYSVGVSFRAVEFADSKGSFLSVSA